MKNLIKITNKIIKLTPTVVALNFFRCSKQLNANYITQYYIFKIQYSQTYLQRKGKGRKFLSVQGCGVGFRSVQVLGSPGP